MKVGSDKPALCARFKYDGGAEQQISDQAEAITLVRNKINAATSTGYGDYSFPVTGVVAQSQVSLVLYGLSVDATKAFAVRNVVIEGVLDEEEFTVGDLIKSVTVDGTEYISKVKDFKTDECYYTTTKLSAAPSAYDMQLTDAAVAKGWTKDLSYSDHYLTCRVLNGANEKMLTRIYFPISNPQPKGAAPTTVGRYTLEVTYTGTYTDESGAEVDIGKVVDRFDFKAVEPITLTASIALKDPTVDLSGYGVYFWVDGQKMDDSYTTFSVSSNGKGTATYDWVADASSGKHTFWVESANGGVVDIKGLDEKHDFFVGDNDYSVYIALVVIFVILAIVLLVWVYRKPVKNFGKPKSRR